MLKLTQASQKMFQALPVASDLAQQAAQLLVQADFSLARVALILLAKPLAQALRRIALRRPCLCWQRG